MNAKLRLIAAFKISVLFVLTPFVLVVAPFFHLVLLPIVDASKRFKREFKNTLKCYNLIRYKDVVVELWRFPT